MCCSDLCDAQTSLWETWVEGTQYCSQLMRPMLCYFKYAITRWNRIAAAKWPELYELKKSDLISSEADSINDSINRDAQWRTVGLIAEQSFVESLKRSISVFVTEQLKPIWIGGSPEGGVEQWPFFIKVASGQIWWAYFFIPHFILLVLIDFVQHFHTWFVYLLRMETWLTCTICPKVCGHLKITPIYV